MDDLSDARELNLRQLAQRTVGFLCQKREGDTTYLAPAGSGTIVSLDGAIFIITAGHVARAVMSSDGAGVYGVASPSPNLRAIEFDPRYCDSVEFWNGLPDEGGPDIAAIKMPPGPTEQLAQMRVVYNINRRITSRETRPEKDLVLSGFPSTATAKNVSIGDFQRSDLMTLSIISGRTKPAVFDAAGFDRFVFDPMYENPSLPSTFEGMSGGGVWYLDADDPATVPVLAGVAYYQSPPANGKRSLTCSGPVSVYDKLLREIVAKWFK